MSGPFTPLESEVLDALAWDLRDVAPDLAGQFAESLPGSRRNTGSGLFTELIVDRFRPSPLTSPTGRFGTVHAMVGDLPDPIAFQVELRQGRLLALHGDAYGQETRPIDFARVPFDQVFTVDARGESVAFDPAVPPSPDPHPLTNREPQFAAGEAVAGSASAPDDLTSLQVGLWVASAVVALLATAALRLPLVFAAFLALALGKALNRPSVVTVLARLSRQLGRYEYRPPQK